MNQPAATLAIFKAGTHVATDGKPYTFTDADLAEIVAGYNPELAEAPIVVGHPSIDAPAYGWARSLEVRDGLLYAEPHQVEAQFAELVNAGRMKKISASIYLPDSPGNPTPGKHYLRHIGFLGAQPPAVKGLPTPNFAEDDGSVEFSGPLTSVGYSLVDVFQRMRDWFIERDGVEQADRIIPQWQIRSIAELTQHDDSRTDHHTAFAASSDDKTTEFEMYQQTAAALATREQELKDQAAALEQREKAIKAREATELRKDATDFAEGLVASGQLLPRQQAAIVELLLALPAGTALNFSESEGADPVNKPANEVLRELLTSLPKRVDFSEKSGAAEAPAAVSFAAPPGVLVDVGRAELHQRAKAYAATHNVSFLQAVQTLGG